jgi:hypothetical protein
MTYSIFQSHEKSTVQQLNMDESGILLKEDMDILY